MKNRKLLFAVVLVLASAAFASAQTTRIHLFRLTRGGGAGTYLYPIQLLGKTLNVPFGQHVVIETTSDSLGFYADKKIGYIKFEKGKDYYFTIRYVTPYNTIARVPVLVDEVSEQNFKLTVLFNDASLVPQVIYKAED